MVKSEDGSKKLGSYRSHAAAQKRLGQIEYFKHKQQVAKGGRGSSDK